MDNALALAESSTLGFLTLITGATPPRVIRELLLPPLDFDMSVPTPQTQTEPSSTTRSPPVPIKTQTLLTDPMSVDSAQTPPTAGPGAFDTSVIPPSHDARTLVLCFDGTGDQFDADVCAHPVSVPGNVSLTGCCPQNSNIVQFFSMLKKDDRSQQMVYYQVSAEANFPVFVRCGWFKIEHARLALGRIRSQRSRHRLWQKCKRQLTWLLPTTSTPMSWVRSSVDIFRAVAYNYSLCRRI